MSFRAKLILSYLVIILIFLSLGAFVIYSGQIINRDMDRLDEQFELLAKTSAGLEANAHTLLALKTSQLTLHKLLLGETEALPAFEESIEAFDEHFEQVVTAYESAITNRSEGGEAAQAEIEANLASIQERHEHFHEDAQIMIDLINAGDYEQAGAMLDGELDEELATMDRQLAAFEESSEEQIRAEQVWFDDALHAVEETTAVLRTTTIVLVIVSIVAVVLLSTWMSKQITDPIELLSEAAVSIEDGSYELGPLNPMAERQDEFGPLARVFLRMADEVHAREQSLRRQVHQLRIKIDREKEDQQVAEITETDFFKQLEAKADKLRGNVAGSET